MLSIQEMVDKTADQRRQIERNMDSYGSFHPTQASIYTDQSEAVEYELRKSIHQIPLREFLVKSGTTGIAGAAYLVPDKIHDQLISDSTLTDIVPLIGDVVNGWNGGDLKVNIVSDDSYKAHEFASGGSIRTETVESMQATITPKSFGIAALVTDDLIEDAAYDMVEHHLRRAAYAIGKKASSLALTVLKTATDGWGTINSGNSGDSGETKWSGGATNGISEAIDANLVDGFISNTIITTGESWTHSISETLPTGSTFLPVEAGYQHNVNNIDIILHYDNNDLTTSSKLETLVFDRNNALLTGRKRWMQANNYADPVKDLAGTVITCRQDSVTLYDDAVFKITET